MAALSAGGNLGEAIGLQGITPQFKDLFLERQRQRRLDEAKAKEARDTAIDKWGKYLDIQGVHRLDIDEANGIGAEAIQDLVSNYDNYTLLQKTRKLQTAYGQIYELKKRNVDLEAKELQLRQNANTPEARKGAELMQSGTWADIAKYGGDKHNIFRYNPESKYIDVYPIPKVDTSTQEKQLIADQDRTVTSTKSEQRLDKASGRIQSVETQYATLPFTQQEADELQRTFAAKGVHIEGKLSSAEGKAILALQEQNYRRAKTYQLYNSKRLPENYYDLPEAEAETILTKEVATDIAKQAPVKVSEKYLPFAPEKGTGFNKGGISTYGNISINVVKDPAASIDLSAKEYEKSEAYQKYRKIKMDNAETPLSAKEFMLEAYKTYPPNAAETIVFTKTNTPIGSSPGMLSEEKGIANSISLVNGRWYLNVIRPDKTARKNEPQFKADRILYEGADRGLIEGEFTDKQEGGIKEFIEKYNLSKGRAADYGLVDKKESKSSVPQKEKTKKAKIGDVNKLPD